MDTPENFTHQLVTFMLLINEKIMKQMAGIHKGLLTASQFFVVATVGLHGRMTMSALADRMDMSRQQATKIVNQLVELGFVCRMQHQKDRRIVYIGLTDKANDFMHGYLVESMKVVGRRFSTLEEKEFLEMQSAMEVFNRILPHIL